MAFRGHGDTGTWGLGDMVRLDQKHTFRVRHGDMGFRGHGVWAGTGLTQQPFY